MYAYVQPASPWLSEHIKSYIRKHAPDAKFIDNFDHFPTNPRTVFQFCDGWALNRNFALLNSATTSLINAYPNSDALARKDYLARVVELWIAKRPESILKSHVPATVRLSLDYAEYVEESLTAADDLSLLYSLEANESKPPSERDWWIMKPALVDCGAGIRLFSTVDELANHLELAEYEVEEEDDSILVYKSQQPLPDTTPCSEKGDPDFSPTLSTPGLDSLDVLVTATGALSLKHNLEAIQRNPKPQYLFKEGGRIPSAQMREFVAQQYVVSIPPMEKRKWHARAYVLSVGRLKVYVFKEMLALLAGEDYEPPWLYPSLKSSLTNTALQDEDVFVNRESMRNFWDVPDDLLPGDWKVHVFEQVCAVSAELFRAAAHTMADKFTTVDKCFELFAVDFLIDSSGTAWLLEVNETPAFYNVGIAGPLALRLMESVICVTMEHKSNPPLPGTPLFLAPTKTRKSTTTQCPPPTSFYHNIFNSSPNGLIFCTYLLLYLMPQYTEDQLRQALEDISNGKSQKRASLEYGIPRSTLQLRLQGGQTRKVAFADWQRLSPDQESKLAQWVRIQASLGLAPTHQQVKEFAERVLAAAGDTKPLGKGWIYAFVRRNPIIKVQRSRSIDSRRVNGASTEVIRNWFKFLAIPEIKDIKPANRYNMDETGILEGQGANGLVLGMAETTSVRKKQPGSRAWVSIIECISALGRALRPLIIFKGKTVQQQWFPLHLVPYDGWEFTATDNGWTTDLTAIEWLEKVFIPQTMPEAEGEARLLIVDGHGSHTTTDFMWNCYINNIHLLFLPPHSSHVLQPLDQSVFSPVKSAYRKELGYLSQWNDSTIIGKRNFLDCYQKARLAGLSVSNIRSGWKWTGLHPVAMVKPLMNPMVLPEPSAKPTTPKPTSRGKKRCHNGQQTTPVEPWDSASSAVVWSTPRKLAELSGQLHLYTQLDNDTSTQRLLFRKVKKGFTEQAWQLAAAQQQLAHLRAQVTNAAVRKRKTVQIDPNTKFANIRDIHRAQIEAGEKEVITAESSDSECPSEAGSCIVVGVVEDQ